MKNKIFKTVAAVGLVVVTFTITGCNKPDIEVQKKQCQEQNKDYLTKKVLNYRSGEYVLKVECI